MHENFNKSQDESIMNTDIITYLGSIWYKGDMLIPQQSQVFNDIDIFTPNKGHVHLLLTKGKNYWEKVVQKDIKGPNILEDMAFVRSEWIEITYQKVVS